MHPKTAIGEEEKTVEYGKNVFLSIRLQCVTNHIANNK